jgi:hypothetical protein
MRAAPKVAKTPCLKGESCACGRFLTIGVDVLPRVRQREAWGTSRWRTDYGRRVLVETTNSILKHHFVHMQRHFTRVFGLAKNTFLLTFTIVGANLDMAESFRRRNGLGDPWGDRVADAPARSPRGRRSARAKGHEDVLSATRRASADPP